MSWNLQGSINPLSLPTATSVGMAAWTIDPTLAPSNHTPTAGSIYFVRAYVDNPVSCTHIYAHVLTAGSGLSGCFLGVYQPSVGGNLLAQTADISTSFQSAADITATFASSPTSTLTGLTHNQEIYLALLIGSGTPPSMLAVRQYGTNLGMSSDYRYQKSTTTGNATLPSTVPTLSTPAAGFEYIAIGP